MKLTGKRYTARDAYYALKNSNGDIDLHGQRIWSSRVPNKVKIFAWLYFKDRLSTRTNLYAKHILNHEKCERCARENEDRRHIFFRCHKSAAVWSKLGLENASTLDDVDVSNAQVPSAVDVSLWSFILQTILWWLWDARNGEIFRQESPTPRSIITKICDDLVTWRKRLKNDQRTKLDVWCEYLLSCNTTD
jgi:hypothetical protein